MAYIISLLLLCAGYGVCLAFMKRMRQTKLFNLIFVAAVYIMYLWLCVVVFLDVGFYDWNFQNTLPCANVSPFMFFLMPLALLLPPKFKKRFCLLISLLSVGMLLSAVLGCVSNAVIRYKFHPHFLLDYGAHFVLSAFGVYLVKSGQVELKFRECLISGGLIFGAAACMLLLNGIFGTNFFGLSLTGDHNIYNRVLVESGYLSALIYFCGLSLVLLLGAGYCSLFKRKTIAK